MSTVDSAIEAVKATLSPYIRTREEAAQIRRVLALHVDSCVKDASVVEPLALVETSGAITNPESRGLRRDYLRALNANIKARAEYDSAAREHSRPRLAPALVDNSRSNHLYEHLRTIRLQKKHQKLQTLAKYLDILAQKPAAAPGFLDPEGIFKDSPSLPEIPQEVVNGLTQDLTAPKADLGDLISQLEKQVLRAKLLLQREERLLEEIKARSSVVPGNVSDSVKFEALNATRNELIGWIEGELAKAGDGAEEHGDGHDHPPGAETDPGHMEGQLASIREKFASYLSARKALLHLVSQPPQPILRPKGDDPKQNAGPSPAPAPTRINHLLSPYLERLLAVSHEQKALITQKSHLNITIAKQLKENCQVLDHVTEESQLLLSYPAPGSSRRKLGFGDSLGASESLDLSSRVKPWVYAADSAKIKTLEVVAEKIEEGQAALDGILNTLDEVDRLLGRQTKAEDQEAKGDQTDEDIWLAGEAPSGQEVKTRKHIEKKTTQAGSEVWDMLDGSLGLLRSDDDPR